MTRGLLAEVPHGGELRAMILRKSSLSSRDATPTRSRGTLVPKPQLPVEPASSFSVDHHSTLAECYGRVIDAMDSELTDVVFRLGGGQRYGGICSVLAMRCAEMRHLLQGEVKEVAVRVAEVVAAPRAFRQFLYYLHVGQCSLDSVSDVLGLYEVAESFRVVELQEACADYLDKADIVDDLLVDLCNFAVGHGMAGLTERVVNHIADHADFALGDPARAAQLPLSLLRFVFQSSDIALAEVTLVRILMELSPAQQHLLLPHIRLPRVPAMDMMRTVVPSGLFEHSACLAALAYRENPQSVDLPAEWKLPRNQSAQAASKLAAKKSTSKIAREPSGPWGRAYLRFVRSEGKDDSGRQSPDASFLDGSVEGGEATEGPEASEPSPEAVEGPEASEPSPEEAADAVAGEASPSPEPQPAGTPTSSAPTEKCEVQRACRSEEEDLGPPESEPSWRSSARCGASPPLAS